MSANKIIAQQLLAPGRAGGKTKIATQQHSRSILYQNGSSLIEHIRSSAKQSPRLAITLAPPWLSDVNGFGYLEQQLTAAGFDVLAIKQVTNIGYADLDPETLAKVSDALPAYASRIILGSEDAATAALRLFAPFEGVRIVALSPNMSLDCTLAGPVQADISLLYDPHEAAEAANHDAAVAKFPRARTFRLPRAGVPARFSVEESGTILALMAALAENEEFDANLHYRQHRKFSPTALYTLGNAALRKRHFRTAEVLLKRSFDLEKRIPTGITYCQAVSEGGNPKAAATFMATVVNRDHGNPHGWAAQAWFEEISNQREEALISIRRAIELLPNFEAFHVSERRLLKHLHENMKLKQQMTSAALDKARAELALQHGHGSAGFSWERAAWLAGGAALILAIVATAAVTFRLV
ncbi:MULTISPECIES: hypothetical protein [unclassified Sphingobium]|uniref:hypothetical protein n=1 Tax=unclassified Sphingobium TaxID=2611147 RepID=UPI0035A58FDC